jgi:serine phosphatase RsbU (regulator of sigma subunit)
MLGRDWMTAQPSAERLALLYRISQTFNSSLDLDEVLNRVMDEVIAATHAERGFLMLHDAAERLVFRAARGLDRQTIDAPEFQISRGVVERVAHEGQPQLTSDAQSDQWLGQRASVMGLGLRAVLCVPLQLKGATLGVIYVDNRVQSGIFMQADLDLLTSIAASAATAIENARLYQVAVEKGRLERELQVAHEVQTSLLPRETPHIAGWEFATWWQPAREISGDFYDFIPTDQDQLGVVIADVSDKGMPAALFMALTRSIVRASVATAFSPADAIIHANRLICADAVNGMFVTLCYVRLDASGQIVYANAGHNPPLWYRADQDQLIELTRTGMALGVLELNGYEQRTEQLNPGDFVVLYTDGVTEVVNAQRQEFGIEHLRQVILENRRASAAEMVTAVEQALGGFSDLSTPFDDITVVMIKRIEKQSHPSVGG